MSRLNRQLLLGLTVVLVGGVLIDRIGLPRTVSALGAGLLISMALILLLPETKGMDLVRARRTGSRTTTTGS